MKQKPRIEKCRHGQFNQDCSICWSWNALEKKPIGLIEKGVYQNIKLFKKNVRYYLNTHYGQIKVFVEGEEICIQFFVKKGKK